MILYHFADTMTTMGVTLGTYMKNLDSESLNFSHSMEPSDQVESLGIDYRRGNYKIDRQFNSLKLISFISSWSKTGKCDQETSFRP